MEFNKRIVQFGYNLKLPEGLPLLDCRAIRNPYPRHTSNTAISKAVRESPHFELLVLDGVRMLDACDAIGVGCGYGVHRSGEVVREILRRRPQDAIKVERIGKPSRP